MNNEKAANGEQARGPCKRSRRYWPTFDFSAASQPISIKLRNNVQGYDTFYILLFQSVT